MKRRHFIKNLTSSAVFLGVSGFGFSAEKPIKRKHITILHTNDTHSHIESFSSKDPRYPNKGGVAKRATLIEQIRLENPNTLLLDAGDIFQGTPYFNYFKGELEFKLMSMMKYDAATLGNHDFDNGLEGFDAQLLNANFSFISSNYDFSNTILDGKTLPYKIFNVDEIKIGVYGLGVELEGLVTKELYQETKYLDPVGIAQDMEQLLKVEKKCDLIICLSHLGYRYENSDKISDLILAEKTRHTDLIIGGHTHTFLDEPTLVLNQNQQKVIVNQAGCYGINLGRIDFYFEEKQKTTKNKNLVV